MRRQLQLLDGLCMQDAPDDWNSREVVRSISSQRMNGEPLTIGGYSLGHAECPERWHELPDEMDEFRAESPYRESETIDWWVRAGRPWPMSVQ